MDYRASPRPYRAACSVRRPSRTGRRPRSWRWRPISSWCCRGSCDALGSSSPADASRTCFRIPNTCSFKEHYAITSHHFRQEPASIPSPPAVRLRQSAATTSGGRSEVHTHGKRSIVVLPGSACINCHAGQQRNRGLSPGRSCSGALPLRRASATLPSTPRPDGYTRVVKKLIRIAISTSYHLWPVEQCL